jgi:phage gp37-like protein
VELVELDLAFTAWQRTDSANVHMPTCRYGFDTQQLALWFTASIASKAAWSSAAKP